MANSNKISRRNFMQQSAMWAAAFAGAGSLVPGVAQAARETELNILCWEGYNSAQVLDPFRSAKGATVKAESLTNDPTMINRLRAGEINVWDLINVNNPWARKIMYPEKLIKPLDRARLEPYFAKMMPEFKAPYKWAMDDSGTELLGMAQRFGPYSYVVNTDKISREAAEDQGWSLFSDPANAGKFGILESDDWNVFNICLVAGFDPFKEHSDEEVEKFKTAAETVFKSDDVGNPVKYRYEGMEGALSPTTLRYVKVASDLKGLFGDKIGRVAEIGCGYGGQALVNDQLLTISHATLFDLPFVNELIRKYLNSMLLNGAYSVSTINEALPASYDLAISNYAISELPSVLQRKYIEKVVANAARGYLTMNSGLSGNRSAGKLSIEQLREMLPAFEIFEEAPLTSPFNYIIVWGHDKDFAAKHFTPKQVA